MNNYIYNNESEVDINSIDNINNEIRIILEEEITRFDEMVDYLWNNVMVKHIENGNLLQKLSINDKDKFYNFMLHNSKPINKIFTEFKN